MMPQIEFTYESHDGLIKVPEKYQYWLKKPIKVILLVPELPHQVTSTSEANTWLGCMSGTGQILGNIVSPLDDNLLLWEVLAT